MIQRTLTLLLTLILRLSITPVWLLAVTMNTQAASDGVTSFYVPAMSKDTACLPNRIAPKQTIPLATAQNTLEANLITQTDPDHLHVFGKVVLSQPGLVLLSDEIALNRLSQEAYAFGEVQLHQQDIIVTGSEAYLNQKTEAATLKQSLFQFPESRAHGSAKTMSLDKKTQIAQLTTASFTTCPLINFHWQARNGDIETSEKYDWELDFERLEINNQRRRIYGYNTVLYFQTVPVFYTPYIDFPMDDRASGFLFPTFGSYTPITRTVSETYVSIPYYFNLAPHYDDTLTLTKMQDRGWLVENELRYLQPHHRAELTLTGLNDQVTKEEGLGYIDSTGNPAYGEKVEQRWRGKLLAQQNWLPGLNSDVLWHETSDENFYADIPVETTLNTATYTERHVNLDYANNNLQAGVHLVDYLRLSKNAPENYEKRPEFSLNYEHFFTQPSLENLSLNLATEVTEFEVSHTGHNKPEAQRTYVAPSLQYNLNKPYGSLTAETVANKLNYQMQDNGFNSTGADAHQYSLMQYALKGNLIFERLVNLGEANFIQTLEPQVQYLYVPFQQQSQIPLFDTADKSLDFSNLFSYNRFSGLDRFGDTNQVSAALSTRLYQSDGTPLAEAGLGQIFYFNDRKVTLNDTAAERLANQSAVSDYFVKLGLTLGDFEFASTSQYAHENYELSNANSRLKYHASEQFELLATNTVTNFNQADEQEAVAAGFNWQIDSKWALGTYVNYDFTKQRKSEIQHALRYDSCCWASELSVKETQLDNGLYNYSFQYLIEFKGLSSVGTPFKNYLSEKLNF